MTHEDQKLALEKERLAFEQAKFEKQRELDEQKFRSEVAAKKWAQLATFVPVLVVVLGFYLNQALESRKKALDLALARHTEQVKAIDRQLAEFYYPVKVRLERDNAVWEVSAHNKNSTANLRIADDIEARLILPNHEEVMELIKSRFYLLSNASEQVDLRPLIAAMNRYQRHVTIYRALRESKDARFPLSVCSDCGYPSEFEAEIVKRIQSLESQRSQLLAARPL